jgi:hypothetical protein
VRNIDGTDFVDIFETRQKAFETFGKRLGKIILRCEHLPDRCSDNAIAGVSIAWR